MEGKRDPLWVAGKTAVLGLKSGFVKPVRGRAWEEGGFEEGNVQREASIFPRWMRSEGGGAGGGEIES